MKKLFVLIPALALLFGTSALQEANGQGSASAQKVGLIDMAHVFKNYKKFEASRELLKKEIEKGDAEMKGMADQIKSIQNKLKSDTIKKDSPEYIQMEKRLVDLTSQFTGIQKNKQREFLRKESKIYKEIYLEVSDAVALYAKHYNFSLVMRFNREGVEETEDPSAVLSKMNRQVVFFDKQIDITKPILNYLNGNYGKRTASGSRGTSKN